MDVKDGLQLSLSRRFALIMWLFVKIFTKYRLLKYRGIFLSRFVYEDLYKKLHAENARSILSSSIHLKGALIKIVQIISSRVDIFPDEYTSVLSQLQDKVPPVEYRLIKKRVEREFGKAINEVFDDFETDAVASASLGQVHFAKLKSGEEVAVKVQYPGIEKIIDLDLKAAKIIVSFLKSTFKNIDFNLLIGEVEKVFAEELNYLQEGKNAERFRENFAGDPRIYVPKVYWEYTRPRVLTLERINGIRFFDVEKMKSAGINPKEVACLTVESYCTQVLEHGFMHADPHPGNIFVTSSQEIIYVDFGMMKVITKTMRDGIKKASLAAVDRDAYGLTHQLLKLGFLARGGDVFAVEDVIQYFMDKYADMPSGEIKNLDVKTIAQDLSYALQLYQSIQIPEDYILVGRGISLLEGMIGRLAPDTNLLQVVGIYIKKFIYAEKKDHISQLKEDAIKNMITLFHAPEKINALITQISRGRTNIVMEVKNLDKILSELNSLRKQTAYGMAILIGLSIFFLSKSSHFFEISWAAIALAAVSGVFFARQFLK